MLAVHTLKACPLIRQCGQALGAGPRLHPLTAMSAPEHPLEQVTRCPASDIKEE